MATGTTRPTSYFTTRMLVAYLIAYAIAAVGIVLAFALSSVPWLAFGIWLAASLTVLLIDRSVGERTPRGGYEATESFGAIFHGSPAALTVIAIMGVAALLVAFLAHW
ncbi:hypothetical protein [Vitiosangium sp. GDMCC 1.1324]|uniref:hypothetical protein n=1 Tax=Vitiosangium sp. (strain GDMCC 1.1324) TaxID=2138576 RepID=UPI000D383CBF|nr:hypothetical protein [Vitiosangium sp. GDMCC 1.1324]PTL84770.1 hypothetical protein DAT35_06830 [Vitiosangium sp. GDMCC 1.1324]